MSSPTTRHSFFYLNMELYPPASTPSLTVTIYPSASPFHLLVDFLPSGTLPLTPHTFPGHTTTHNERATSVMSFRMNVVRPECWYAPNETTHHIPVPPCEWLHGPIVKSSKSFTFYSTFCLLWQLSHGGRFCLEF